MTSETSAVGRGFVTGDIERALHIRAVSLSHEHAQLEMASGSWLTDPVVGVCRAALGVVLDDVTGYIVVSGVSAESWPVSLGIRMDFLRDPPVDGTPITVTGDIVARDGTSGTTQGSARDSLGSLLALVTQRSHVVGRRSAARDSPLRSDLFEGDPSLRSRLEITTPSPDRLVMGQTLYAANVMGIVHGGVLVCGSEFAAMNVLGARGELRTTSVDIAYVRPADALRATTFRSEVVHRGRSQAIVRVVSENAVGKPCSIATVTVQPARRNEQ
ncbi:hypothetical protein [Rhodococcoides fascians]|uniref:hypothetical protein n=1 Tax=Rhodococcoides fascians TaxID=1828 RepID=UPI0005602E6D|nr:hypothetical protein [Rhodococcus fascians]